MNSAKKEYKVGDLIIDDEYGTIDSTLSVVEAAKKIKELNVPDLVVVDKESKKVLGVIADYDIVQNIVAEGKDPKTTQVTDAMYIIEPVTRETPVTEAFKEMQEMNVNIVPVIEDDKLLGVASIHDCWSYIPDENPDEIGLIRVSDPKTAEFSVASVITLLAFIFGILMPAFGVYGFFSGKSADLSSLFAVQDMRTGIIKFASFNAIGADYFIPLGHLAAKNGAIWILIVICSYFVLIFGVLALFSIFYGSISDMRHFYVTNVIKVVIPYITIGFMILQWILYGIAFTSVDGASVDGLGLFFSILSMLLLFVAINRDFLFRTQENNTAKEEVVG
ncbi:MAG: CBS domain-containing protein [Promethearchaeota archaeon]